MKTKFNVILTFLLVLIVQTSFAQNKKVSGTVSDNDGLPLPGATVTIKGTSSGVATDFDGNYTISAVTGDVLLFSYLGYASISQTVGASNTINISLEQDNVLEEVVIEAYSNNTTSKEKSTSAITTLSAESVDSRPNASVVQMLQGQVAGLNIGTGSGQPGANSLIILRGVGSINGNIEPLFIVDGVPVDEDNFRSINNSDIATISILKDASASSLYGSRGANGAIVITTKRGKFGTNLQVEYKAQTGFSVLPSQNFEVMNSRQKLELDRSLGEGLGDGLSDNAISALSSQINTNWSDVFFRQGLTNSHNISISSGSDKTNSYSSFNYFEQEGVTRRSNLKRFSFRNNFSGKSDNEKFNFSSSITANYSISDFIQNEGSGTLSNPFLVPYLAKPYFSQYNPDGSLNIIGSGEDTFANTPYSSLNNTILNTNLQEEVKFIGNIRASYEIAEKLTAGISFGMDYTQITSKDTESPNSVYGQSAVASGDAEYQGSHFESFYRDVRLNNIVSLNYNNVFDEAHSLDLSAYMEYSKSFSNSFALQQIGLNDKLYGNGAAFIPGDTYEDLNEDGVVDGAAEFPYIPSISSGEVAVGMFSYFGVLKYDYKERYGLQSSLRRDASSRFSNSNKWGTFYSVSARWNIHNESFMEGNTFFNKLKLRASYGTSGNDRITGGYYGGTTNTYDLYGQGTGYNATVAYYASSIANKDLKWEMSDQLNIGVDFTILKGKLSGSVDVYDKNTEDLFQSFPISSINGTNAIQANIGSMNNQGAELSLNWKAYSSKDFSVSIFANGSYNKNKVTSLPNGENVDNGGRTILAEDRAIGSFFAVRWAGVNPANGQNLYYDVNGDITDVYSEDDRVFIDKVVYPTYQGGFGFNSNWKNLYLDTQFSFVADIYRNNGSLGVIEDPTLTSLANSSTELANAWQQPGDITNIPALTTESIRNRLTDRYIEDASYLRLRNITLGYNFKSHLKEGSLISDLKVFVQAQNLITWSKWRGWDPESSFRSSDFFDYPTSKIFSLGVDLKF